jgi:hypothetical protein
MKPHALVVPALLASILATAADAQLPALPKVLPQRAANNPPAATTKTARVSHVDATVRPAAFQGKCPVTLHFTARVTVVNPPARVRYEWIRSDGATSAAKEILIKGTEGIIGGESWQLGGAGEKMAVWERVHVLAPNNDNSRNALVRIACQ